MLISTFHWDYYMNFEFLKINLEINNFICNEYQEEIQMIYYIILNSLIFIIHR
jgi:hypothetical protein